MEHVFIINPTAGKGRKNTLLQQQLSTFPHPHRCLYTKQKGDGETFARQLAQAASPDSPLRLYVCGGDGTLNEVVNGVAGYPHVAITNVPTGTGNDFLKIFSPHWRASFLDLASLAQGKESTFDLIRCNHRLALDMVCAGVDARVGAGVDKYKGIPLIGGMGAYALSLAEHVLFRGITRPMEVTMGGTAYSGDTTLLCICNGRYYGGGFLPVPEAMPDDGVLDALLIGDISLFTLLRLVKRYATGRYRELGQYVIPFHGQEISLSSPAPLTVVLDGEPMVDTRFTIGLSPKKVQFFYPAHLTFQPSNDKNAPS